MRADNLRRGPWFEEEDERLKAFVAVLGERRWDSLARESGLRRSGKSCRLRWLNYLRPCLKHGPITLVEERLIIQLHEKWGNKWADIARRLPGRTDNEIKNYWRTHIRKRVYSKIDTEYSSLGETSYLSDQTNNSKYSSQGASSIECNTNKTKEVLVKDVLKIETDCFNYEYQWKGGSGSRSGSDCTVIGSPYENRISDWISTLPREQGDSSNEISVCENNSFDYSCDWNNLWDLDLFN